MSRTKASFAPIRYAIFTLVAVLPFSTTFCHAQRPKLSPEKHALIEAAVAKFMASTHVPGLAIAVVENGEYEWGSGFGLADLESDAPASEHTLFRLGSISKSLTSVGALQIWERGQLDLDAP